MLGERVCGFEGLSGAASSLGVRKESPLVPWVDARSGLESLLLVNFQLKGLRQRDPLSLLLSMRVKEAEERGGGEG